MKTTAMGLAAIAVVALLSQAPALAHHALAAQFDSSRTVKVTGVIAKIDWVNPHIYIAIDVPDDKGQVTRWNLESLPPVMMRRAGLRREALPVGGKATAWGYPSKDATRTVIWPLNLTFEDGRVVQLMTPNEGDTFR